MTSWVIDRELARGRRPGYTGELGGPVSPASIDDWLEDKMAMGIPKLPQDNETRNWSLGAQNSVFG